MIAVNCDTLPEVPLDDIRPLALSFAGTWRSDGANRTVGIDTVWPLRVSQDAVTPTGLPRKF